MNVKSIHEFTGLCEIIFCGAVHSFQLLRLKKRYKIPEAMSRILLASDDQDLSFLRLQELLEDETLTEMSDRPSVASDQTKSDLIKSGLQVSLVNLDALIETLEGRVRLGLQFDALVFLTIRPYKGRTMRLVEIARRVRNLSDNLCFSNGLRAKVLPIILVDLITLLTGTPHQQSSLDELSKIEWCYVQPPGDSIAKVVGAALREWRTVLYLELDYVGYAISFNEMGEVQVDHLLRRNKRRESQFFSHTTSPDELRQSGYLRLPQDLAASFAPYRKLQYALNRVRDLPPKQQEPVLQACLDENPVLIYRGSFVNHFSQPELNHPDPLRRKIIPDFILQPPDSVPTTGNWEVLEIKTSEASILDRGHFTEFFMKALEQLKQRYGDYFANARTKPEQVRKLGVVLERPRLALLIGRRMADDDTELLSQSRQGSDWHDIQIINYDDLFDFGRTQLALQREINEGAREL